MLQANWKPISFTPTCSYWINIPSNAVGGKQRQTCSLLSQTCRICGISQWSGGVGRFSHTQMQIIGLNDTWGMSEASLRVQKVLRLSVSCPIKVALAEKHLAGGQRKWNKQKLTAALFSLRDTSAFQSQNKERSLVIPYLKLMSIRCIKRPQKTIWSCPKFVFLMTSVVCLCVYQEPIKC